MKMLVERREGFKRETSAMTVSLFVTWIVPIVVIAAIARFGVDTVPPTVKIPPKSRPINIDVQSTNFGKKEMSSKTKTIGSTSQTMKMMSMSGAKMMNMNDPPSPSPTPKCKHPTSYQTLLDDIENRERFWKHKNNVRAAISQSQTTTNFKSHIESNVPQEKARKINNYIEKRDYIENREVYKDPKRMEMKKLIESSRDAYEIDPNNIFKALKLADLLRQKDLTYHDGGLGQQEALQAYQHAIDLTLKRKGKMIEDGKETTSSLLGTKNVSEELFFDYTEKSVDGLLCAIYTNMGKMYFMANMFERAVQSYTKCIEIESLYLDAIGSRGSSYIILGKYAEAGHDLQLVIDNDQQHLFNDAFTGMAKVLVAKEDAVPQGWNPLIEKVEYMIVGYESNAGKIDTERKQLFDEALNRLHHVMFTYHDFKTKNRKQAWNHLTLSYKYKMSSVNPFNVKLETQKLTTVKTVFHKNFWPDDIGSQTNVPIFIIGFVRSGSTLLERVLDAHPQIVGTGEDSVFNGRLDQIRNSIVQTSIGGDMMKLKNVVAGLADSVAHDMKTRWKTIVLNNVANDTDGIPRTLSDEEPLRFTDKMLTNYFNVGFIHMLFPKALILHVARNPMDVLWSAYKHEFPPGGLDYTSDFTSLASMYHSYRDVIRHWDDVLPGRITHIRYEDLVNDTPDIARRVIAAVGLDWNETVLEFHKKKQAVNTLSTSQVRKGIYKSGMNAWKMYEKQLAPLVNLIGKEAEWDLKTTV